MQVRWVRTKSRRSVGSMSRSVGAEKGSFDSGRRCTESGFRSWLVTPLAAPMTPHLSPLLSLANKAYRWWRSDARRSAPFLGGYGVAVLGVALDRCLVVVEVCPGRRMATKAS